MNWVMVQGVPHCKVGDKVLSLAIVDAPNLGEVMHLFLLTDRGWMPLKYLVVKDTQGKYLMDHKEAEKRLKEYAHYLYGSGNGKH